MTDLSCVDYSEKAIVVRGNTKEYKEELKKLGGKFNANLKDGAGWIFPKKNEDKVLFFIANGKLDKVETSSHDKKESSCNNLLSTVENAFQKMSLQEKLGFISKIVLMVEKGKESIKEVKQPVRETAKHTIKQDSDSDACEDTDDSVDEYVKNYRKLF